MRTCFFAAPVRLVRSKIDLRRNSEPAISTHARIKIASISNDTPINSFALLILKTLNPFIYERFLIFQNLKLSLFILYVFKNKAVYR